MFLKLFLSFSLDADRAPQLKAISVRCWFVMKVICALTIVLLSLTLVQAQNSNASQRAPEQAYTRQLISLLTELQKNPWLGWESGTEVVVRYLVDRNASGTPLGHPQPDIVYKVMEADKRLITTQVYKGKPIRRDFLIKDQPGL